MTCEEYLETLGVTTDDLEDADTIHQGQCCDCRHEAGAYRVWLCRVAGGVTIESNVDGKWRNVAGDCDYMPTMAPTGVTFGAFDNA